MSDEGTLLRIPRDRRGAGSYDVIVEVASGLNEATVAAIGESTRLLIAAGNNGGFPSPGVAPVEARLLVASARLVPPYRMVFEIQGDAFDLYAFEFLRNMADRLARTDVDVRQIIVSRPGDEPDTRLKAPPADVTEYDAYPPVSSLVGFPVEREPLGEHRLRRCLVELRAEVEAEHVNRTAEWVACWFQLLEAGAFSLPVGPAWETDCVAGEATIFDERSIEICVNRFQASECAWYPLLNILDRCWRDERLISMVTID